LHPLSKDILETGMVFNVEPGWYEENDGGARQCDMVVVTETGAEILTPFQNSLETLVIG
jgi:Xaa-Pro aminopeptidase